MLFENGWQRGRIRGITKKRQGCNVVVQWEGETVERLPLLDLDKYITRKRGADQLECYSWCSAERKGRLSLFQFCWHV